jgi:hypothetical protein
MQAMEEHARLHMRERIAIFDIVSDHSISKVINAHTLVLRNETCSLQLWAFSKHSFTFSAAD